MTLVGSVPAREAELRLLRLFAVKECFFPKYESGLNSAHKPLLAVFPLEVMLTGGGELRPGRPQKAAAGTAFTRGRSPRETIRNWETPPALFCLHPPQQDRDLNKLHFKKD